MAWTESLPSGKYRGGYRLPTGEKRRVPGSFDTKRRALAEAATAEEAAARPGWKDPKAAARTWGEWNAEWWPTRGVSAVTAKNESSMLKRVEKRWGDVALAEIDREAVRRWTHAMSKELAPTSVNRILAVFRASLGAAVDAEVLATNPATKAGVAQGDRERLFLTRDQASDLVDSLTSDRDKAMVTFMFGTGVRFGEAAGLQIPRLATDLSKVHVIETWLINEKSLSQYPKSRKFRVVPMPGHVAKVLEPIVEERSAGFVFPGDRSPAVSHSSFLARFGNAAEDAGVPGATPHATRHSYASWLLESGVPMVRVSRLLGHRNTKVTDEIYGHISTESGDNLDEALAWK